MDKRIVCIGQAKLGAGQPAVCIPVMGESLQALGSAAAAAEAARADILELRADSFSVCPSPEQVQAMCSTVREHAPKTPLLFTLRTVRDGGPASGDASAYARVLKEAARYAHAVDVELSVGEETFAHTAAAVHEMGAAVIGSSHDFAGTPDEEEICARLLRMEKLGADVCKIAVMPKTRLDVLALMRAAVMSDEALLAPVIAIAMGRMGALTRVGGEAFGSCLTFGTAGQASAPGQLDAVSLRAALGILHSAL